MASMSPSARDSTPARTDRPPTAANRLGLDYRAEARRLGAPVVPIIDAHAHINGPAAAQVYREARDLYGVTTVVSQSRIDDAEAVRDALGGDIRFVAVPRWMSPDRRHAHTQGFLDDIGEWRERFNSRMVKFWTAPRIRDIAREDFGDADVFNLDSEWRQRQMRLATDLGMMIMVHVADPDTWFATRYRDASKYLEKKDHYRALERLGEVYTQPWLLAHMGGWPEDLKFLDGLLTRHANFVLDTSATKWMVREISRHPRAELLEFLEKFRGRVLFGSDIVTMDQHLAPKKEFAPGTPAATFAAQASTSDEAFELYASRYWALRTMFETGYVGESPIADPDLAMVEPGKFDDFSAPRLSGKALPKELLRALYRGAYEGTLGRWWLT